MSRHNNERYEARCSECHEPSYSSNNEQFIDRIVADSKPICPLAGYRQTTYYKFDTKEMKTS